MSRASGRLGRTAAARRPRKCHHVPQSNVCRSQCCSRRLSSRENKMQQPRHEVHQTLARMQAQRGHTSLWHGRCRASHRWQCEHQLHGDGQRALPRQLQERGRQRWRQQLPLGVGTPLQCKAVLPQPTWTLRSATRPCLLSALLHLSRAGHYSRRRVVVGVRGGAQSEQQRVAAAASRGPRREGAADVCWSAATSADDCSRNSTSSLALGSPEDSAASPA